MQILLAGNNIVCDPPSRVPAATATADKRVGAAAIVPLPAAGAEKPRKPHLPTLKLWRTGTGKRALQALFDIACRRYAPEFKVSGFKFQVGAMVGCACSLNSQVLVSPRGTRQEFLICGRKKGRFRTALYRFVAEIFWRESRRRDGTK